MPVAPAPCTSPVRRGPGSGGRAQGPGVLLATAGPATAGPATAQAGLPRATWWLPPAAAAAPAPLTGQVREPSRPRRLAQGRPRAPRPCMGRAAAPTPACCQQRLWRASVPGRTPGLRGDGLCEAHRVPGRRTPGPSALGGGPSTVVAAQLGVQGPPGHALTPQGPGPAPALQAGGHAARRERCVQPASHLSPRPSRRGRPRQPRLTAASPRRPGVSGHLAGVGQAPARTSLSLCYRPAAAQAGAGGTEPRLFQSPLPLAPLPGRDAQRPGMWPSRGHGPRTWLSGDRSVQRGLSPRLWSAEGHACPSLTAPGTPGHRVREEDERSGAGPVGAPAGP